MEVAICNQLKGKDLSQVQELFIDGTSHNNVDNTYLSDEAKRLLEQCVELESLAIVNWRLTSLKNFPHLPKLKKLVLSHNSLRDGLHHLLEAKLNLFFLSLTHNLISKVSELICLGLFDNLQSLELVGCSVCKAPDFASTIFRVIPSLRSLDVIFTPKEDDCDPFNKNLHTNNNIYHHHTANNNGINGTLRPPPQHGKLYNMSQLMKDYNENFALYYNYNSSNSYGPHEFSTSDIEQMFADIPSAPQAPPPPSSPKVQEVADTPAPRPAAETESTDDEEEAEESFEDDHAEDLETLQRVAQQMIRSERPTRRAAQPQSRAAYQAYQAQMSQLEDDDDEDEDDDDFNPGEELEGRSQSSNSDDEDEPAAQEDKDEPEGSESSEEGEGQPSPTSQTSGTSSSSKRERDSNADDDAESTQPKKQR